MIDGELHESPNSAWEQSMKALTWITPLFIVAAVYDGILGLLFLAAPQYVFDVFRVPPPNHPAYVQFPAALLLIFAWMFVNVARAPLRNRGLVVYGILLKVAYCAIAGWYWATTVIPNFWISFAAIDLVMGVLFACAYVVLHKAEMGVSHDSS
ncbi:MAG: hypothetical protein IT450_00710 [Phycisphaerales bacterium]|nr:hypothetical protein [Phycisphaerales bacterium]